MLARDDPLTKMIIILTLLVMRAVLARSVGASVALAIGASVVPAHAAQPVVVAVDGKKRNVDYSSIVAANEVPKD